MSNVVKHLKEPVDHTSGAASAPKTPASIGCGGLSLSMSGDTARFKRDRDRSVPDASRDSWHGVALDQEPGEERAAIPLSAGA